MSNVINYRRDQFFPAPAPVSRRLGASDFRPRFRFPLPAIFVGVAIGLLLYPHGVTAKSHGHAETLAQAKFLQRNCLPSEFGFTPTIPRAKVLIVEGRLDEASRVLDCIVVTEETETDIHFLRGRIAEAQGDLKTAVDEYRTILAKRPELTRVRLELARLLFLMEEDTAARYHFELALGADLPDAVEANITRFLRTIRQRQRLRAEFSIGIVPDSNVNTATEQSQITLFGLPFELSQDATQESGVGLSVRGAVSYKRPLSDLYAVETGIGIRRIEHSGDNFDDMSLHVFAGLRRSFAWGDAGLRGIFSQQWFGGDSLSHAAGGEFDVGGRPTPRVDLRLFLGGESRNYDEQTFLDGYLVSAQGMARYSLSPDSLISLELGIAQEDTDDPSFTNTQPFVGIQYLKAFPIGVSVSFGPLFGLRLFDDPIAAFGQTRRDELYRFRTEIVVQKEIALGFAPIFSYTYTHNRSNIDLFSYRRHQFEIGFTKRF